MTEYSWFCGHTYPLLLKWCGLASVRTDIFTRNMVYNWDPETIIKPNIICRIFELDQPAWNTKQMLLCQVITKEEQLVFTPPFFFIEVPVARQKKWTTMYICGKGIDFATFNDFDIWFWNCFDIVVFFAKYYLIL